jgi:hypothetical protein
MIDRHLTNRDVPLRNKRSSRTWTRTVTRGWIRWELKVMKEDKKYHYEHNISLPEYHQSSEGFLAHRLRRIRLELKHYIQGDHDALHA